MKKNNKTTKAMDAAVDGSSISKNVEMIKNRQFSHIMDLNLILKMQ